MARRPRRANAPKTTRNVVTRRRPRRRRKASTKKPVKISHRTHPSKRFRPPPGHCTWCHKAILKADGSVNTRRSWCSQACVGQYLLRADPKMMRQHVFFRDNGRCADCGTVWRYLSDAWDADHVEPLFMAYGDPAFWEPENVVILCRDPCHKKKSASDEKKYGFVRRLAKPKPQKTA